MYKKILLFSLLNASASSAATFEEVQKVLNVYCMQCHSGTNAQSDVSAILPIDISGMLVFPSGQLMSPDQIKTSEKDHSDFVISAESLAQQMRLSPEEKESQVIDLGMPILDITFGEDGKPVSGDPENSYLYMSIEDGDMPKKFKSSGMKIQMDENSKALIKSWIEAGAPFPDSAPATDAVPTPESQIAPAL